MKQLLLLETVLTGLVFVSLLLFVNCKSITARLESALSRVEKKPLLAVLGIIVIAIALRAACLGFFPAPQPRIHDEFSYLLAADTFVHDRVSNPTHPFWQFFESFHINQVPTYVSMYPPAQGLVLAAGRLMGGNAWTGVLISTAIMCAALCWMLQGWLPGRWAFIGGLIAVVRIALFSYWGNSYWGGSVAAIGGLLVLGALPRMLKRDASVIYFLVFGLGILILANSRPYEGLLLCVAMALAALTMFLRSKQRPANLLTVKWLAVVLTLFAGFAAMGFYNSRVTGHLILMPYKVHEQQYAMAHAFLWQRPTPDVEYRHEVMKKFWREYYDAAVRARSVRGFFALTAEKLSKTFLFFIGPILALPLIAFPRAIRDRRIRFLMLTALFAVPGLLVETWFHSHYAAPFIGIVYVLLLQCLRHVRFSRALTPRRRYAAFLTVPAVIVLMTVIAVITFPPKVQGRDFGIWCCNPDGPTDRTWLISRLQTQGERHLVFVEYTPEHNANEEDEWVYNAADIDGSPVVFARSMDAARNTQLAQYFSDRQVWRLVVGHRPLKLERYK